MGNKECADLAFTVRQARKYADITIEKMSKHLGMDKTTYIRYERNPKMFTYPSAIKISELTGIPFNRIYFGVESSKSSINA